MKGAVAMELEPLTTIPGTPMGSLQHTAAPAVATPAKAVATLERVDRADKPAAQVHPTLASIEPQVQRRRDNDRRRILEEELSREEQSATEVRTSITQEQQNPTLVAAVRAMQQAAEPTATQLVDMRNNIEKASGRIRGLQATVAEHEKNIEALKKELGALK
jgi:chromosome segregation ATPase